MLNFNVLTIFPEMFSSFTETSICKRAIDAGMIGVSLYNFRDYTLDKMCIRDREKECASMPGFLAVASEAVEFDAEMAPAVEFLLARTVIVDTLQNAISIMPVSYTHLGGLWRQGCVDGRGGHQSGLDSAQPLWRA